MENERDYYKEFMDLMKRSVEFGELLQTVKEDPRHAKASNANDKLDKIVFNFRSQPDQETYKKPSELKANQRAYEAAFEVASQTIQREPVTHFVDNLESILDKAPKNKLEDAVLRIKPIAENVDKGDKKIYESFAQLYSIRDFKKRYGDGKLEEKESEQILGLAAQGAIEEAKNLERERQKALGYSKIDEGLVELRARYAQINALTRGLKSDAEKKYVNKAFDSQIKDAEKKYAKLAEDSKTDIHAVARRAINKVAQKGNPKDFSEMYQTFYQVLSQK